MIAKLAAVAASMLVAASAFAQSSVTEVGSVAALSTVSQRHLVRIAPAGRSPTYLMAVQRDTWGTPQGLHWYRSDDEGRSWRYYKPIFNDSSEGSTLHMVADAIVVGDDVAIVISYDTISTGFPSDSNDWRRRVYFQNWRHDGNGEWLPGTQKIVASPPSGHAFHRAVLARDSRSRLWVQAWERESCSSSAGPNCTDNLRVWFSSDNGSTFSVGQTLARLPLLGGGRLISLGTRLMMLWGDFSWDNPARYMIRSDDAPTSEWQGPFNAFSDGDSIYHGAALNAVADGQGGLYLVYKDRRENLYYRRFDGSSFGARTFVDGATTSDWSLQPAITLRGSELFICTNHPVDPTKIHQLRMYRLSQGFSTWTVLDGTSDFKGYPTALETIPTASSSVPCAYVTGGGWPSTVKVARISVTASDGGTPEPPPDGGTTAPDAGTPPPPPDGGTPKLSTLTDSFPGPQVDVTLWRVTLLTSRDQVYASNGELVLAPASNDGNAGTYVSTQRLYDATGSSVHFNVRSVISSAGRISMRVRLHPGTNIWNNDVGFWLEYGTLMAYWTSSGSSQSVASVSYDASRMSWWRIREANGRVYWETSANGVTWSVLAQLTTTSLSFSLSQVGLSFETRSWSTGSSSPGQARFASLNAGSAQVDAGTPPPDAGTADAGTPPPDAGTTDAGTSPPDAGTADAGTPPPDAGPVLSQLTDPFSGPSVDATVWTVEAAPATSSATAANGVLSLNLAPNVSGARVLVTSRSTWVFSGSSAHIRALEVTNPNARARTRFVVVSGNAQAGFWYERGRLSLFYEVNGVVTQRRLKYSATTHAWWRLREAGGTTFWETSSNGTTWTARAQAPTASLGVDPRGVRLRFEADTWGTPSSSPGTPRFSRLNQ